MSRRLRVDAGTLCEGRRRVDGDEYRYLFRALRLAVGDTLELFDGAGQLAAAEIVEVGPDRGILEVGAPQRAPAEPALELTAMISLIKGERMDWCVQKLTELGVSTIVPVAAARSVVRLTEERAGKRQRRLESIAVDAARQCGRAAVPKICAISPLPAALALGGTGLRLIFSLSQQSLGLRARLQAERPSSVAVLIGPEGGFEPAEVLAAEQAGFEAVGLGPRILRAETAAIAAVTALQFALGDLGGLSY